jgi:hypothetical protein
MCIEMSGWGFRLSASVLDCCEKLDLFELRAPLVGRCSARIDVLATKPTLNVLNALRVRPTIAMKTFLSATALSNMAWKPVRVKYLHNT